MGVVYGDFAWRNKRVGGPSVTVWRWVGGTWLAATPFLVNIDDCKTCEKHLFYFYCIYFYAYFITAGPNYWSKIM